jgi:arabinogalactan endo-1,4-beta-galactosidase
MKNVSRDIKKLLGLCLMITSLTISAAMPASAQFARGADIGWLSQMEAQNYVFKNNSGVQDNCLDILKGKGLNALRLRVWVNPSGGYCGKKDIATMSHRADSAGFKVMLDFHLSDTWADPSHQTKPAAWTQDSLSQLLTHLYDHVYGVLDTLKSIGVTPAWIQIGNETNDGMLWEDGRASTHMSNFAAMIKAGYNAAKAVDTTIQVIVHLSDGHNDTRFRWMFDGLQSYGAKWDIIGMSVYPYWANLAWAIDDSLALITMKDMIARYNTKVMVVETGYLYNQPAAARSFLLDLIAKTRSVGGLGVFYWEPEYYGSGSPGYGYQLSAWDPATKAPTAAMDAFIDSSAMGVRETGNVPGYGFTIHPNPFNPSATIDYDIPSSSQVAISVFNVLGSEVARLVDEYTLSGHHQVTWAPRNASSGTYFCRMHSGIYVKTEKILYVK